MKIIATDNLNRETVSDVLIASGIQNASYAKVMVDALNNQYCTNSSSQWFFMFVPDDLKLHTFEP